MKPFKNAVESLAYPPDYVAARCRTGGASRLIGFAFSAFLMSAFALVELDFVGNINRSLWVRAFATADTRQHRKYHSHSQRRK